MAERKRRKRRYVPYDYEAAYQEQLEALEEENEKRILKEGRTRSIYATKEIRAGDQLEVEIYPEFSRRQQAEIPDEGRRKKQLAAQKNLNDRNSRKKCERLINENFTDRDVWATLTYSDSNMPEDMQQAKRNMQNYIKRLNYHRKKRGLPKMKYIYVTECSSRGRWHHHIIMDGDMDRDAIEDFWKGGSRNQIRRLKRDADGLIGMARYITKDKAKGKRQQEPDKYQKQWVASKGLRKPEERVNHYKTKQTHVNAIVTGRLKIEDHLKRWYGDYEFAEATVRYNKFNGRFYIYGRMRMKRRKGT